MAPLKLFLLQGFEGDGTERFFGLHLLHSWGTRNITYSTVFIIAMMTYKRSSAAKEITTAR